MVWEIGKEIIAEKEELDKFILISCFYPKFVFVLLGQALAMCTINKIL